MKCCTERQGANLHLFRLVCTALWWEKDLQIQVLSEELLVNANLSCVSSKRDVKESDCPYEHHWAHQALLELICVAGPEMPPYERRLEYGQKLHGGFPNLQNSKRFSVNWKMKHVCLWEKSFPKNSPYIFLWIFWCSTSSRKQLAGILWIPNPPFTFDENKLLENLWLSSCSTWRKNDLLWVLQVVLFIARGSRSQKASCWYFCRCPHPEDFRTYLTHLHELSLPFISGKRQKLKWKLMCLLTSLLIMFVISSLMHSIHYNELKNNNS